jgi:hypothetical protein
MHSGEQPSLNTRAQGVGDGTAEENEANERRGNEAGEGEGWKEESETIAFPNEIVFCPPLTTVTLSIQRRFKLHLRQL